MRTNQTRLFCGNNARGNSGLEELFGQQSAQRVVRDEVAFAPGQDPNLAIINASRRFDAGLCLVSDSTPKEQPKEGE